MFSNFIASYADAPGDLVLGCIGLLVCFACTVIIIVECIRGR